MEQELLSMVRARLLLTQPFYGALSMYLESVPTREIPTLRTDGTRLLWNPDFLASLPTEQQEGVLAHQIMHCALGHPYRVGARNADKWNVACDHVINLSLKEAGLALPQDVIVDPVYKGLSAEQVYSILPEGEDGNGNGGLSTGDFVAPAQGAPEGQGGSQGPDGEDEPNGEPASANGEGFTDGEGDGQEGEAQPQQQQNASMSESDWQVALEQAAKVAAAAGHLPGCAAGMLKDVRQTRIDWRAELREFLTQAQPSDYSWTSPNRRFISQGMFLPGVTKEQIGIIVLGVDTSGSTQWMMKEFAAEFAGIISEARPERVHVVYWDAKVQATEEYSAEDGLEHITMRPKGGGGTSPRVMFDWVKEQDIEPMALVCLTDLEFGKPEEPGYPVLWCTVDTVKRDAPFGSVLRIPKEV